MFSNVMPKRSAYFDLLAAHTDRVMAGASATLRLETSADRIKDEVIRMLYESFTTPINRDQLHTLTLDLDRVLDGLQHVANAIAAYRIIEATPEARAMASLAADACMRLNRAVVALADKQRGQETVDLCQEIERIETKADKLLQKAVRKLFEDEGDDAALWRAMKMRELYALLEAVIDACKRAAKTIEEILIENA